MGPGNCEAVCLTLQRDNIEITTSLDKVRGGFSMLSFIGLVCTMKKMIY